MLRTATSFKTLTFTSSGRVSSRTASTSSLKGPKTPIGSLLYVPASSQKFLDKSLESTSPTVTYDLEDSVHPSHKDTARSTLTSFLSSYPHKSSSKTDNATARLTTRLALAVRPNSPFTARDEYVALKSKHDSSHEMDDDADQEFGQLEQVLQTDSWGTRDITTVWGDNATCGKFNAGGGPMMILPKVNQASMLTAIDTMVVSSRSGIISTKTPVVASIESPQALLNLGEIAAWKGRALELVGLMFAAEDYCASSGIQRSPSRTEMLYPRSAVVAAARAFGLSPIDMVCIDYKNSEVLKEESEEGRRLGFKGKQAIHPSQVETIMDAFSPSQNDIARAQKILDIMSSSERGAEGLVNEDGKEEMIDKPMILQAKRTLREASAFGRMNPQKHSSHVRSFSTSSRRTESWQEPSPTPPDIARSRDPASYKRVLKDCSNPDCNAALLPSTTPCPRCRTPSPVPSDLLAHAWFGLVPDAETVAWEPQEALKEIPGGGFDINVRDLRNAFLKRQQKIHPDSFSGADEKDHLAAETQSAQLNKAYQTLANPLARAKYLLEVYGQNVEESDSLTDPELLMEIMEAREQLDECSSQEECDAIRVSNKEQSDQVVQELAETFKTQPVDFERAKTLTTKLQYLQTLDNAAKEWQPGKRVEITH